MKQPNTWSCYVTAASYITGIPISSLIKIIGHDGSKETDLEEENKCGREAFVHSEIALALYKHGWAIICVYAKLLRTNYPHHFKILDLFEDNIIVLIQKEKGLHALAFKDGKFMDPATGTFVDKNIDYKVMVVNKLAKIKS